MEKNNLHAWLLLLILSVIWGSSFILIKKGLVALSPGEVAGMRVLMAAVFVSPIALNKLKGLSFRQIAIIFSTGVLGTFIPSFLFAFAETRLGSGITGIFNALTPAWIIIVGSIFFNYKIRSNEFFGFTLAFAGCVVLVFAGSGGQLSNINSYAIFVLLATLCYGFNVNIIKHKLVSIPSITISTVSLILLFPFALIYLLSFTEIVEKVYNIQHNNLPLLSVVVLGFFGTGLALILFNQLIKLASPVFAGSVTYFIPIVALLWGALDHEKILFSHIIGTITIITGVFILNIKRAKITSKLN
ncbi:MAG: DMT family transporter [Cyclobacteriaceae bacterium]